MNRSKKLPKGIVMNYYMNYRGFDIWEYIDTIIGTKSYYVHIEGQTSSYETIVQAKAAINFHIMQLKRKQKFIKNKER